MKVSVVVLCYNHELYISKTLESIVSQRTNFEFEILIGDDCSKDKSRKIIDKFHFEFPKKIRKIYPSSNLGPNGNYLNCFNETKGKYIAFCEGDDYWIDTYKLQKQVDFLEQNPKYGGVSTNNRWLIENEHSFRDSILEEGEITFEDLCESNLLNSQTILFRKSLVKNIEWMKDLKIGDWPLHLLVANQQPYYRLQEITAVYRVHDGGVHSLLQEEVKLRNRVEALAAVLENLDLSKERLDLTKGSIRGLLKKIMNYNSKEPKAIRKMYFKYGGTIFNKTILKSYIHELF